MEKKQINETPHYELLFIVSNKFTEEESKDVVKKVQAIIEKRGGEITYSEEWGKKKLAYPIKHFAYGYYNLFEFDLGDEPASTIDRDLRMMSDLLRHMIVAKEKRSLEEIQADKEKAEAIIKKKMSKEKEEKDPGSTMPPSANEEPEKKKDENKIELKDLDDKLDKLLDTKDLI